MIHLFQGSRPRPAVTLWLLYTMSCVAPQWAGAADAAASLPDPAELEKALPGLVVRSIAPAAIDGLFEVVNQDGDIFYTDASGGIGLFGRMVELSTRRDITAERTDEIRRVDFEALPFELAIKRVHGNGSRRIAVFSDPDCPYCRHLETTLKEIDNITIYLFPYPLEELHPGATVRSKEIWCSPDRVAAWEGWLFRGTAPEPGTDCDAPIERLQELGRKLMVSATPGLMFESGRNIAGALSAADIERLLSEPAAAAGQSPRSDAPPSGG